MVHKQGFPPPASPACESMNAAETSYGVGSPSLFIRPISWPAAWLVCSCVPLKAVSKLFGKFSLAQAGAWLEAVAAAAVPPLAGADMPRRHRAAAVGIFPDSGSETES